MGINEYLCRNYDKNNKGYVIFNDIIEDITYLLIIFGIAYGYFYGLYNYIFNNFKITNTTTFFQDMAHIDFLIMSIILLIIVLALFIYSISKIKIAECKHDSK